MANVKTEPKLDVPKEGTVVDIKSVPKAGDYVLSPKSRCITVTGIYQYLCKNSATNQFHTIKILPIKRYEDNTYTELMAREILHTEYTLLKLLADAPGIVKVHKLFEDCVPEEQQRGNCIVYTGKMIERVCLVLDCYTPIDFFSNNINLQLFVVEHKKLTETLAITIFRNVLLAVQELHKRNIVHRDLKLANILYDKVTHKILLFNLGLGKLLLSEKCLLSDQKGSSPYVSPDVINGKPYAGKPSDMWALGVLLYAMLYGQYPFHDITSKDLFDKIRAGHFNIPMADTLNIYTIELIKGLLTLDPAKRFTVQQAIDQVDKIVQSFRNSSRDNTLQVVPTLEDTTNASQKPPEVNNPNEFAQPVTRRITFYRINKNDNSIKCIPVQQVNEDVRPVIADQLVKFAQIFNRIASSNPPPTSAASSAATPAATPTSTPAATQTAIQTETVSSTTSPTRVQQVPEYRHEQPVVEGHRRHLTLRRRLQNVNNVPGSEQARSRPTRSERIMRQKDRERQRNPTND